MQPGFKVAKGPPALIVRGVLSGEYLSLPDQKYSSSMIEMLIFHNGSTHKKRKNQKAFSFIITAQSGQWATRPYFYTLISYSLSPKSCPDT